MLPAAACTGQSQARRRRPRGGRTPYLLRLPLLLVITTMVGYTFIGVGAFLGAPGVTTIPVTHVRPARASASAAARARAAASTIASGGARMSSSVLLQAAAESDNGGEGDAALLLLAEVRKMRAAAIKEELGGRGVPTAGIVDKEDLVALLVRSRQQQPQQPQAAAAAASASSSISGAGGVESKGYAAARVPFRQRTPPSTLPGEGSAAGGPKSYICVDVTVGGQQLEFLVDSGATPTIITERTRARLGLQPLGGGQRLEGVTATGAGAAPRVMLNDCRLGGQGGAVVNMDALVMGNEGVLPSGVDGLLGVKWMQYHGIVDIDFRTMTLSVYPYDARAQGGNGAGSTELADLLDGVTPALLARGVPMRQDPMSAIFFVDLHLTGPTAPPTPAIVDLGAGMSIVNWRAAGQVGVTPSSPGVIKNQMQVWGIDGRTLPIDLYDFKSIYLAGRVPLSRSGMGVADLPAFGLIGYGNRPVGVVGMDMMSGATDPSSRRIVFDFRHNMLYCA